VVEATLIVRDFIKRDVHGAWPIGCRYRRNTSMLCCNASIKWF
jgi:hypothetical protein